ncbi:hypothetical protein GCM10010174_04540 [Kutzneria viridogrisea]|uniref:LuxR-family transcription regulator n=2 Tax=Kutzneria TaxID=43356 RepID=W5WGR9_9PSEU|nr:LuxR C-terminal-related transcriptional regulator [Kutzneria albida]AHH99945.1 LuxR-family transcription regulator [Kutzneria albida DSM 43870]MBA8925126.1 PAS domain S-box-containing protein [Kutzneria viridogrisea]
MGQSQVMEETRQDVAHGGALSAEQGQSIARATAGYLGGYEHIFKSFFERYGMCMAILDARLRIQEANTDFLQQFGITSTGLQGKALFEFFHPSVKQHLLRQFGRLTENHRTRFTDRVVALPPGGRPAFAGELTGIAVHGDAHRISNIIVFIKPERSQGDSQAVVPQSKKLLTELDARILEGVAVGTGTVRLATSLYLSRQGVEYHVSTMLRKFKVPNRAALVSKSYSMGILTVGAWPPHVPAEYIK